MRQRQSNIELLRCVAMAMILVVHMVGPVFGFPQKATFSTMQETVCILFESLAIIGVNLFVLISGFFGINLTRKGVVKYVAWVGGYSIAVFIVMVLIHPDILSAPFERLVGNILFLSHTDLWFVKYYFLLMLISPLLNAGFNNLEKRRMTLIILSLIVISCYFGWFYDGEVNPRGYNLMQMITMYGISRYISRFQAESIIGHGAKSRVVAIACYLMFTLLIMASTTVFPVLKAFAYNSPLVMASSVAFFCIFLTLRLQSRFVNSVAASSFAVYLLHKNQLIWVSVFLPLLKNISHEYSGWALLGIDIVLLIVVYAICIAIDKVRIAAFGIISSWFANGKSCLSR